jgi:osmotically-inducible protein OsmY
MTRIRFALGALVGLAIMLTAITALAEVWPDDGSITVWVLEALENDNRIDESRIEVDSNDGIVTLTGDVDSVAQMRLAEEETRKIAGVQGVIDELVVKAAVRGDAALASDVRWRLDHDSLLNGAGAISVSVHDGTVDLDGTVDSWSEREEAALTAGEVKGVIAVNDELTVAETEVRADDTIAKDARAALKNDVYLSGLPLEVTVRDGMVTVSGQVGNAYEKQRANNDIWVLPGVRGVNNELKIVWYKERGAREVAPQYTDAELEEAVRGVLARDGRVDNAGIGVTAVDGDVRLVGSVPTYSERKIAAADSRNVVGTAQVDNELLVNASGLDDDAIATAVRTIFQSDFVLCDEDVHVAVDDGVATLTGSVDALWKKAHARELTERVTGVQGLIDKISVKRTGQYDDAAIAHSVEERLRHNAVTEPVASRINVEVRAAKVTLTGTVDTWSERIAADELAFLTDGVWAVESDLQIQGVDSELRTYAHRWPDKFDPDLKYQDYVYGYFEPLP